MRLIDNAEAVFKRAYSFWLMVVAALSNIAPDYIPYLADFLPRKTVLVLIGLAILARFIKQDSVSGKNEEADDDAPIGI